MPLRWIRETSPTWDADKQRVIGGAPAGAFVLAFADGEALPGEWWSVRDGDTILAYGRLDVTWGGDAEILLAVDPARQRHGVGSFALSRLEAEAAARDINYVHNRIRAHDERDLVHDWLVVRGFRGPVDGDLRKLVGSTPLESAHRAPKAPEEYDAGADPADRGPGHEELGGYVDLEHHRY